MVIIEQNNSTVAIDLPALSTTNEEINNYEYLYVMLGHSIIISYKIRVRETSKHGKIAL